MLDKYFKRPILWDYLIGVSVTAIAFILNFYEYIEIPEEKYIMPMSSDLSTISITSSGFILTLLTVLITFKSNSQINKNNYSDSNTTFELFFASDLYIDTIKHLKNCVKSLIIIAVLGYLLKMLLNSNSYYWIYYFNLFSLFIIVLTLWRCLLILTAIFNMQKE